MRRMSQRQAKRMMQRMGMDVNQIDDAKQVIIRTSNKEITIDGPEVTITQLGDQRIYQVMGGEISERKVTEERKIPEEDVRLVAQQAQVSLDDARKALENAEGDLAQAILLLGQR